MPAFDAAPIVTLDENVTREFCETTLLENDSPIPLVATSDANLVARLSALAGEVFFEEIRRIRTEISNADVGIAAIDVPVIYEDVTKDAITGALVALSISQHIMPSVLDRENRTPFSMFNASEENNAALNELGIKNISPVDVLEFHSDGTIRGNTLAVPNYVALYNVFINYAKRGNFYWVPSSSIPSMHGYVSNLGCNNDYLFDLTPSVYSNSESGVKSISPHRARTSVFQEDEDGRVVTFMNGTFLGRESETGGSPTRHLAEFQQAIANNPVRYAVPQESRRMVILNNAAGFHARDVFEEPFKEVSVTRCYLRSASLSGRVMGEILAN